MDTLIALSANYLYLVVIAIAGIVFVLVDTPMKWQMVKLVLVVFPLCFIVAKISGNLISSPRPFVGSPGSFVVNRTYGASAKEAIAL